MSSSNYYSHQFSAFPKAKLKKLSPSSAMKTDHPKLKPTPPPPLFSCAFFRQCTQTSLSPTTATPPPLPLTPPPPPPPDLQPCSSSSSSNTSQSFTQWKFPLPQSPISPHIHLPSKAQLPAAVAPVEATNLPEIYHMAELQLSSRSELERVKGIYMLERSLVPNPTEKACPLAVMKGVIGYLKERAGAKPATKVLLALCLTQVNRSVAVEAGAVGEVVEALADLEGAAAERALAALELMCMVAEGAAELRSHALAVPMIVEVMGRTGGRGRENAISALGVIFSGDGMSAAVKVAPPEEVARAVMLGLQGDCTARGRRKGTQLLRILQENGRLDLN